MTNGNKTHFKGAFKSPYLSSADLAGPTNLTISHVTFAKDATKKTRDSFNTAHFVEKELGKDHQLKPMILNVTNCKTLKTLTGSPYLEDWVNVPVTIYVDDKVKNRGQIVEGLRISPVPPVVEKPWLDKSDLAGWQRAISSVRSTGNLDLVLQHVNMTQENVNLILRESQNV